ncbi:MAG: iron-containing alcohol dehydrogenase [Syntrophorhabdales bacterium]|jgi:alcohol dehydrogenase class IV
MQPSFYFPGRVNNFFSPTKIVLGAGAAKTVGAQAKAIGCRRALLVTDQGIISTGMAEAMKECLVSEKIDFVVFDKVELETPARVIDEGAKYARDNNCDLLIALGGGTTIDTTKGISLMVNNKGSVLDYVGIDRVPVKGLPKILIPTTAGSGSEATRAFGVTDEAERMKKAVSTPYGLGDVAILDPFLTLSLPPMLTAETGLDALAHAVEAYVSDLATPFSDVLALEAIRLVGKSLLTAYAKSENIEARFDMLLAATLAGLAFGSGGLGAVHAFSFVLETEHGLGHARAVSVILPHIMKYNKIGVLRKYGMMAMALGEQVEGLTDSQAAEMAIVAVSRMLDETGISSRLGDYGISQDHLSELVAGTMKQTRLFVPNPRNLTEDDVRNIFMRAL